LSTCLKDNLPALSSGILNQNQFIFTSFNTSNGFPSEIQIQVNVLNSSLKIKLNLVDGLIYNSSIYSQVNFVNSSNTNGLNLVV
jgi:hypothetical protein